jgi:hypothetical protein
LPKKYGCGRTKTMAIIHELARNDDENMTALLKQSPYSVGEISHKKMGLCSLHSRCLERPRMQDFAPFYPELLRAQPNRRKSLRDFYSYFLQFKIGISGYKF